MKNSRIFNLLRNNKKMELPPLNNKQLEEISKLKNMDNNLIDCSDINELSDEELVTGHFVYKD